MSFVVDTCVVLDLAIADPDYGKISANFLEDRLSAGLVLCPVTFVELAPQFAGKLDELREFCQLSGIRCDQEWTRSDTEASATAFARYVELKRNQALPKRPIADILIGGFACRFEGLITRNPSDFGPYFPELTLLTPN